VLIIFAIVFILGLSIGSFLNVVIYRLPLIMQRQWQNECDEYINDQKDQPPLDLPKKFNLSVPRSSCPKCNSDIKAWQNIPVVSYLFLGGKCANCNAAIAVRYPLVEAFTALVSVVVVHHFGVNIEGFFALIFTWLLIALAGIDADKQLLPDSITLPLLWIGLAANSAGIFTALNVAVWGAIFGYLALWSVFWGFKLITGKDGMGYGDFKLLAALGAWMGWQALPIIILLAASCGAIVGILQIVINKRDSQQTMPFGPYLAAAGWITLLWQQPIVDTYLTLVGLH
jgi:leader peptidase (prepilin peptidase)/N-methyltransferase